MKRSYTYLKGLLTLALAALTGWMWAAGESISINAVRDGDGKITKDGAGVLEVPASAWNEATASGLSGMIKILSADKMSVQERGISVSNTYNGVWYLSSPWTSAKGKVTKSTANGEMFFNYMDSYQGASESYIKLENVPFTTYTVYLYPGSEGDGSDTYGTASAFKVTAGENATLIKGDGSATVAASSLTDSWGSNQAFREEDNVAITWQDGKNYLKVENLSGALEIRWPGWAGSRRAGLAALQIVNTGDLITGKTFTANPTADVVKFSEITWDEGALEEDALNTAEVKLNGGATLTIDNSPTLAVIRVKSDGAVTINPMVNADLSATTSLANVTTLDCSEVKGTTTYLANGDYSAIPFTKLSGIEKIKKVGDSEWTPGNFNGLNGFQLEVAEGTLNVGQAFQGIVATEEKPLVVTGADTTVAFSNGWSNKLPNNAHVLVKEGALMTVTGNNTFPGDNPPSITLDKGTLRSSPNAHKNDHIKIRSVTLKNNSVVELDQTLSAWNSEGLYLRTNGNKLYAESGTENKVTYGATDTVKDKLRIDSGIIEVNDNAVLTIETKVSTDENASTPITKKGNGSLVWASESNLDTVIEAGNLVFKASRTLAQTFSGEGKIVADGAGVILNLAGATLADTLSYEIANGATLILPAGKEEGVTVPSGCTLKLALSANDKVNGYKSNATINDGGTIAFVEADGSTPVTGDSVNGGTYTPLAPTWTPTSATSTWTDSTLWTNCEEVPTSGDVVVDYSALNVDIAVTISGGQFDTVTLKGGELNKATLLLAEGVTVGKVSVLNNAVLPVALANDTNVTITTTETATLTIDVAENTTLTKALTIDGALVKGGDAALTLNAAFKGATGTIVAAGTLKYGTATINGDVTVDTGATLDFNGKVDGATNIVTLEKGASLVNNGNNIGADKKQLVGVVLNGDATIGGSGNFGLIAGQWGATTLNLNGHKLTKTGANGFWICNTTVSDGEFNIESGRIAFKNPSGNVKTTNIGNLKVTIANTNNAALDYTNGTINWNGDVTKAGAGSWTVVGSFAADKAFTIEEGTVSVGSDVTLNRTISGSGTLAVAANGILKNVLLAETVNLQLAEGARIAFKNAGEIDLGARTITVNATEEPAAGREWAVFSKHNPQSGHNGNHYTLSNVTLKGNGKIAFAGVTGDGSAKFNQTLNVANDSDFSGEIVVINAWNRPIQASLAGEQLKNAVYNFDYNDTDPTESEVQDGKKKLVKNADGVYAELLLTGDATLAGLKGGVRTADQMVNGAGNDRVRSSSGDVRILTLGVPENATPESGAIIGTANNPVALVKTGAGKQTFTAAVTLAGLSVQAGEVEFAGATTISGNVYSTGTITGDITLADATLTNAIEVTGDVTIDGALTITHADEAGETVITCANANAVMASLPAAPATLKYEIVDGNTIKLAKAGAFIVGEGVYETFAAAFAAAIEGEVAEITIDEDATEEVFETPGFKITKSVTIDLGGKTLRLKPPAVGSAGTETLGIQILNTAESVVIKNGKIDVAASNETAEKPIKMMINNYTNLKLENVTLDGSKLYKEEGKANYVLSNNSGTVTIDADSAIIAPEGGIAFDVCKYASYTAPEVTVADGAEITGNIEVTGGSLVAPETLAAQMITSAGNKVVLQDGKYVMVKKGAFEVKGKDYATLAEAYAAGDAITLTANATSAGIKIEKNVTLDLGGYTLTLTPPAVGSAGTETLGIQILKGTTVAINNGKIDVVASNSTAEKPIKMMINNYSTALTLTGVILDGTNLVKPANSPIYVLSNNSGTVTIGAGSAIIAPAGGIAFDVCKYASYTAPEVTVVEGVTINGNIEVTGGSLVAPETLAAQMITSAGNKVVLQDGKYVMVKKGAFEVNGTDYATLADAYAAGDAITLTADATSAGIKITKSVTLDLGGYTLSLTPPAVGSAGTETLGMQIMKGTTVVINKGTIDVDASNLTAENPIKMMIQNYSTALTLTGVTLDGTNLVKPAKSPAYTLSNNSGTVTIDATSTIIAKEGGIAFDVCKYSTYTPPTVTVEDGAKITGKVEITGGTLTDNTGALSVGTTAGFILKQEGNVYTVVAIVLPEGLKDSPAAEAIKAAMQAAGEAGVTEITGYTITTAKAKTDAEVADVADVLAVFDVEPTVDANGVLAIAYEFGISAMTNVGDTVTITAGVDANTVIREDVAVVFTIGEDEYPADEIDGKTATLKNISAKAIDGQKITVKATNE